MEKLNSNNMLQIKKIDKSFGGVKAVSSCSFEVPKGSITALIGPNGAGKSTLFNIISGIISPDAGTIMLDNKDLTNHTVENVSNDGVSRLFQQSHLFLNLTVQDNLLLAKNNNDTSLMRSLFKSKSNTDRSSEDAEMLRLMDKLKIQRHKHVLARELSFGQQRLVELARAILNPHKLLILDEPVAGITPQLRRTISNLLKQLKKEGETILLIEHDMTFTLKIADQVVVMAEGKIITSGNPLSIKNSSKVQEIYLGN